MTFKRVVRESGLTKIELATLYGVSRQTIHSWITDGPAREGSLLARMAETITATLDRAIDMKALPLGPMDKEKRRAHIDAMLRKLQNLKPAPPATKK